MTQALNFTTKAIEGLSNLPWPSMPGCAAGTAYLLDKLRRAETFVLGDHGELLDRSKPRPQVPGVMFRPPFDIVALEYTSLAPRREGAFYTAARSSRRIALAWDWQDDLPSGFGKMPHLKAGVAVASISFMDDGQIWLPMSGIVHMAYEDEWAPAARFPSPFRDAMRASGHYAFKGKQETERAYPMSAIPLMYEMCVGAQAMLGSPAAVMDTLNADVMDEVNAYIDLCYALACKNVTARQNPAPANLNRQRIKAGKLPLSGFHVLELAGGEMPGGGIGAGVGSKRSHLRRGHIRRLGADRVTWVNSTIVSGRGFVDKQYSVKGATA